MHAFARKAGQAAALTKKRTPIKYGVQGHIRVRRLSGECLVVYAGHSPVPLRRM